MRRKGKSINMDVEDKWILRKPYQEKNEFISFVVYYRDSVSQ